MNALQILGIEAGGEELALKTVEAFLREARPKRGHISGHGWMVSTLLMKITPSGLSWVITRQMVNKSSGKFSTGEFQ
jgi:hypothetical protein